jgi:hypothetical protein
MYIHFLQRPAGCIYRLHPPCQITESHLCMVLPEAPENAQFHVTYLALQLTLNFIIFQTMFHCQFMMKQNYKYPIHRALTEKWMHILSQLRWKCLVATAERAIFSCRCNGRVSHLSREQRIFLVTFLKLPAFTFLSFSQKTGIYVECNKDVKLPAENQIILLLPSVLWHQWMRKYFKCYKQVWF